MGPRLRHRTNEHTEENLKHHHNLPIKTKPQTTMVYSTERTNAQQKNNKETLEPPPGFEPGTSCGGLFYGGCALGLLGWFVCHHVSTTFGSFSIIFLGTCCWIKCLLWLSLLRVVGVALLWSTGYRLLTTLTTTWLRTACK